MVVKGLPPPSDLLAPSCLQPDTCVSVHVYHFPVPGTSSSRSQPKYPRSLSNPETVPSSPLGSPTLWVSPPNAFSITEQVTGAYNMRHAYCVDSQSDPPNELALCAPKIYMAVSSPRQLNYGYIPVFSLSMARSNDSCVSPTEVSRRGLLVMFAIYLDIHYVSRKDNTCFTSIKGNRLRYHIKANSFTTDGIESKDVALLKDVPGYLSDQLRNQLCLAATKCRWGQYTPSIDADDLKT